MPPACGFQVTRPVVWCTTTPAGVGVSLVYVRASPASGSRRHDLVAVGHAQLDRPVLRQGGDERPVVGRVDLDGERQERHAAVAVLHAQQDGVGPHLVGGGRPADGAGDGVDEQTGRPDRGVERQRVAVEVARRRREGVHRADDAGGGRRPAQRGLAVDLRLDPEELGRQPLAGHQGHRVGPVRRDGVQSRRMKSTPGNLWRVVVEMRRRHYRAGGGRKANAF